MRPPQPGRPPIGHKPGRPSPPPAYRPGAGRPPNFRPVHGPSFRYPHGYRYRRWSVGLLLPSLFLSSAYIYSNYAALGIGAPPPGHYWVRYGPDLLLVERRSRRIVDVIYGAFY
ncbi:MAG TPA: RcnB family protein [Sphingobium sp.]|uniref:RcnB family protein n=1 Tax=Sphingobium sp. TaxID=1912891 RepID=UPI002ED68B13